MPTLAKELMCVQKVMRIQMVFFIHISWMWQVCREILCPTSELRQMSGSMGYIRIRYGWCCCSTINSGVVIFKNQVWVILGRFWHLISIFSNYIRFQIAHS
eukprot:NODE_347_length_9026_cov_0.640641.p9 type:complete len:101 gc:universal NODE_347_length_9026_cov_0.640641:6828-6526(-)